MKRYMKITLGDLIGEDPLQARLRTPAQALKEDIEKKRKRPLKTNSLEKHVPPFKAVRKTKPPHTVSIPNEHGSANYLPSSTLSLPSMPTTNADTKEKNLYEPKTQDNANLTENKKIHQARS